MIEWAWILVVPTGWVCWTVGGTGYKWVRRYVYPALLAIALIVLGIAWWRWLLTSTLTVLTAIQGYGDRATWPKRWLVGCCYALSLVPLVGAGTSTGPTAGFFMLIPLTAVSLVAALWLTRRFNWVPHKLAEGFIGAWHSGMVVWLVSR